MPGYDYGGMPTGGIYDEIRNTLSGTEQNLGQEFRRRLAAGRSRIGGARAHLGAGIRERMGAGGGVDPTAYAFNLAEMEKSLAQTGALDELEAANVHSAGLRDARSGYISRMQGQQQFDWIQRAAREREERERREREHARRESMMGGMAGDIGKLGLLALLL